MPQDKATGAITDDKRIVAALPTIQYLLEQNAAVIACSHLGKPKEGPDPKFSLAPVAKRLSELLGREVIMAADVVGPDATAKAAALKPGQILLLENTRFEKGETKNDPELARKMAAMADVYVSDAFGAVHRAHASTAGVAAYLPAVRLFKECRVSIGAENCHYESHGAYTGEVAPEMLKELGVKYVVIGHSERRQYYNETDFTVNKKVHAALEAGLYPIVCVGESLEQRELGVTMDLISYQVKAALSGVPAEKMRHVVIAYEPIWAIGTGKTATAEQAGEVCEAIRTVIRKLYGARVARSVTIQYGGSMNAKNAHELLAQPDVDGGLIGGASLKAPDFVEIVNAANQE